eukprot:gnl/TRDRNA2_/TRDRNA2_77361_c0_seq1.p1 gnl/TRDRNA2_/TRDRNA2_77361_c0~~gnl/TRDRNA2_/TRDRNA2_77361_c0_seq1.p1  ORF type:complete len:158 (+),score=24.49 gnl/TRDRNA2_/TRDRNA2_77361_c0_seq1:68-475(+)
MAVHAARENIPAAADCCYLGDGWQAVPPELVFDWVVSNPPVHKRRQDDFSVVEALIVGASQGRLRWPHGRLWIVAQVHVPVGPLLQSHGFKVKCESDGRFALWRAKPREKDSHLKDSHLQCAAAARKRRKKSSDE